MCTRGFADTVTTLKLLQPDPNWAIRWWRATVPSRSTSDSLELREIVDGGQPGGSLVSGATSPVLTITNASEQDLGFYFMELLPPPKSGEGVVISGAIELIEDLGQPVFTQEPQPRTVCASEISGGSTVEIASVAESTAVGEPLHYQWIVNGTPVEDGESVSFVSEGSDGSPFTVTVRVDGCWTSSLRIGELAWTGTPPARFALDLECEVSNIHGWRRSAIVPFSVDQGEHDCDADGISDACEIAQGALDVNQNEIPDQCECLADVNEDGLRGGEDLALLLVNWGPVLPEWTSLRSDLDGDGDVGGSDLALLLVGWGACR